MKRLIKPLLLTISSLLALGVFSYLPRWCDSNKATPNREHVSNQAVATDHETDEVASPTNVPTMSTSPKITTPSNQGVASQPVVTASPSAQVPFVPPGYVPLTQSPVARKWLEEEGITSDDIEVAQERLRLQGYPPNRLDDPGLVRPLLPRRDIVAVNVTNFTMAERASAGSPVPFRLSGVMPDASFSFTRFDIDREGEMIRIRPIGNSSGAIMPGVEIPVDLEGTLEPLPPGTYRIEFPELGPKGLFTLVID